MPARTRTSPGMPRDWIEGYLLAHGADIAERATMAGDRIRILGCGIWGCVFPLAERWVMKLTIDPDEAPLVNRVIDLRAEGETLEGVVFYRRRPWRAPPVSIRGREWQVYAIERENVRMLGDAELNRLHGSARTFSEIRRAAEDFHSARDSRDREHARRQYAGLVATISRDMKHGELVQRTMERLLRDGIVLADVHYGNLGRSMVDWSPDFRGPGEVVIHDLGGTPMECCS